MQIRQYLWSYVIALVGAVLLGAGLVSVGSRLGYLTEGLLVAGVLLTFVTMLFGFGLFESNNDRALIAWKAGSVKYKGTCMGSSPETRGKDCTFVLGERGFLMDAVDRDYMCSVKWDDVTKVSVDGHRVLLDTDTGRFRFVFARPLAIKAVSDVLTKLIPDRLEVAESV